MSKRIPDGAAVTVSGFTDPESGEAIDRAGVIVSGGHTIADVPHYDVQLDEAPFAGLVEASRVSVR